MQSSEIVPRLRVALFTCFHPATGGGGSILRSIVAEWDDVEVIWCHLRQSKIGYPGSIYLGEPLMGGPIVQDLWRTPLLWLTGRHPQITRWTDQLTELKADVYWIVGMNEGFWVGNDLRRRHPNLRIHTSIQDDQEFGMFARMRRYWWMARLARRPSAQLMRRSDSVDTVSDEMQVYYEKLFGVKSVVIHPYIGRLPNLPFSTRLANELKIGHIGTLYDVRGLIALIKAAQQWCSNHQHSLRVVLIGLAKHQAQRILQCAPGIVEIHATMPEADAVVLLSRCNFVYAMYPFGPKNRVFRTTSFPTKLSTYIQSQRPIFAHTPEPSTLASFIRDTGLGVIAQTMRLDDLESKLDEISQLSVSSAAFETVRQHYYGAHNLSLLHSCLALSAED